jgi:hypothetical protein
MISNKSTADYFFGSVRKAERFATWVFRVVTLLSAVMVLWSNQTTEGLLEPLLIVATITGLILSFLIQYWQNEGNRAVRATQISDAFDVPIGDAARQGYYNNSVPPSFLRLVVTTFENSLFTKEILHKMLFRQRTTSCVFLVVFILLLAYRWTSLSWMLLIAQTLFSGDILLQWIRMERFRSRVGSVYDRLHQFFLQRATAGVPHEFAISLSAFADYECSKDEASIHLDSDIFTKLNPTLTQRWEQIKLDLKIG